MGGAIFEVGVTSLWSFIVTVRAKGAFLVILNYMLLLFLYSELPLESFTYSDKKPFYALI